MSRPEFHERNKIIQAFAWICTVIVCIIVVSALILVGIVFLYFLIAIGAAVL